MGISSINQGINGYKSGFNKLKGTEVMQVYSLSTRESNQKSVTDNLKIFPNIEISNILITHDSKKTNTNQNLIFELYSYENIVYQN